MLGWVAFRGHGVVPGFGNHIAVAVGDQGRKRVTAALAGSGGQGNAAAQQQQVELGNACGDELVEVGHR
ncbi:hypothetical protein D3C84_1145550 [compost metagenome]